MGLLVGRYVGSNIGCDVGFLVSAIVVTVVLSNTIEAPNSSLKVREFKLTTIKDCNATGVVAVVVEMSTFTSQETSQITVANSLSMCLLSLNLLN